MAICPICKKNKVRTDNINRYGRCINCQVILLGQSISSKKQPDVYKLRRMITETRKRDLNNAKYISLWNSTKSVFDHHLANIYDIPEQKPNLYCHYITIHKIFLSILHKLINNPGCTTLENDYCIAMIKFLEMSESYEIAIKNAPEFFSRFPIPKNEEARNEFYTWKSAMLVHFNYLNEAIFKYEHPHYIELVYNTMYSIGRDNNPLLTESITYIRNLFISVLNSIDNKIYELGDLKEIIASCIRLSLYLLPKKYNIQLIDLPVTESNFIDCKLHLPIKNYIDGYVTQYRLGKLLLFDDISKKQIYAFCRLILNKDFNDTQQQLKKLFE